MFEYPPGATPLDPDEIEGLIPKHITTQGQLNEWEQLNILEAEKWVTRKRFNHINILTVHFIKDIHFKMFNKTWHWAGQFRQSNKNIGIDWPTISQAIKLLLDDSLYQLENQIFPLDELAARFHHKLVSIHPFPNGNGRHARMMTDILLLSCNHERFTWGSSADLIDKSVTRDNYISALRAADRYDYSALFTFVRS